MIEVEVVDYVIYYNLLLGRSWTQEMMVVLSLILHIIKFPHNGKIFIIDQLSFYTNGSNHQNGSNVPLVPHWIMRILVWGCILHWWKLLIYPHPLHLQYIWYTLFLWIFLLRCFISKLHILMTPGSFQLYRLDGVELIRPFLHLR